MYLVTGSAGLVGSACVESLCHQGETVIGIDNNSRERFFGPSGSTAPTVRRLLDKYPEKYIHYNIDISNVNELENLHLDRRLLKGIVHTAGQPSHDYGGMKPRLDFEVNTVGTFNLLEMLRNKYPEAMFVFTSTNKVYGDTPNHKVYEARKKRFDSVRHPNGFTEADLSVDYCMHSVFGSNKLSADLLVQEYGRYYNLNTVTLRCGCLTGKNHSGVELHGFLSYLYKCVRDEIPYTIYGYEGKQVRDNLHAEDLAYCIKLILNYPEWNMCGEVYNMGGGIDTSCSVLEALEMFSDRLNKNYHSRYIDEPRKGDHKWWVTDCSKFKQRYKLNCHVSKYHNISQIIDSFVEE